MILSRTHPPITLHDLDIYFSERGEEDRADFQHIGITYNINHGVKINIMNMVILRNDKTAHHDDCNFPGADTRAWR